jgi:hypothetical protein
MFRLFQLFRLSGGGGKKRPDRIIDEAKRLFNATEPAVLTNGDQPNMKVQLSNPDKSTLVTTAGVDVDCPFYSEQ